MVTDASQPNKENAVPEEPINLSGVHNTGRRDDETDPSSNPSWQPLAPQPQAEEDLASILQAEFKGPQADQIDDDLSTAPSRKKPLDRPDKGNDQSLTPYEEPADLAALAATVFDTTFYLVPRSDQHYLLGELAQSLRDWLPVLSEMYGWELNNLAIRPDYLRWTLLDFPECLTQQVLGVVRRWTSSRIFNDFPAMHAEPKEQDFWAPGYLVDTQQRDFPTQLLIAYVSRNRV